MRPLPHCAALAALAGLLIVLTGCVPRVEEPDVRLTGVRSPGSACRAGFSTRRSRSSTRTVSTSARSGWTTRSSSATLTRRGPVGPAGLGYADGPDPDRLGTTRPSSKSRSSSGIPGWAEHCARSSTPAPSVPGQWVDPDRRAVATVGAVPARGHCQRDSRLTIAQRLTPAPTPEPRLPGGVP